MSILQTAPLPLIGLVFFVLLLAGVEAGYRGHGWLMRRRDPARAEAGGPDHLLSAVLGLLALLLGFTFSLALDRYEARRDLVVSEANAIGTVWLRTQLLEEPNRTAMSGLLRDYAKTRLAWSQGDSAAMTATNALQTQLWAVTGSALRTDTSQQLSRALMDAVNESFDIASARAAERQAHIPTRVLGVLLLYAVLCMLMLGYVMRAEADPHRAATTLLLVLVTLAVVIILDLDRPTSGAIQVPQQPMQDVVASMH